MSAEEGIVIRPARKGDRVVVEGLIEGAGLPLAGVRESFDHFFVAEYGAEVAGAAGLERHGGDGVLRSVVVAPSARGRGLGSRLTERALEAARSAGLRRVYLLTTTAESYFPRHGFEPIAREAASPAVRRSVEFREACPESAVAMVVELDGGAPGPG